MTQAVVARQDPYILDETRIQDPPTRFSGKLRFLGPGMITSAAVVGYGEPLTATTPGARVGFMVANALAAFKVLTWTDQRHRNRWMRLFGGVLNAGYLVGVAIFTVYLLAMRPTRG